MAKKSTVLFKLVSSGGSGYFVVRKKNPKKLVKKLSLRKYDPKLRRRVIFNEAKLSG